jgi:hypothetical protein
MFISGERLSSEGLESELYELESYDIVVSPITNPTHSASVQLKSFQVFGIYIVRKDDRTMIHHKVTAGVICVISDLEVHVQSSISTSSNISTHHIPADTSLPPLSLQSPLVPAVVHQCSNNAGRRPHAACWSPGDGAHFDIYSVDCNGSSKGATRPVWSCTT